MSMRMESRQATHGGGNFHPFVSAKKPHRGVWRWILLAGAAVILLGGMALWFIDEPLRVYAERQLSSHIVGYTVHIGSLDFHPIGLSVDLENVTVVQDANPDPPLAHVAEWQASVQWEALLSGRLVSDHIIDRPVIHFTRPQAAREIKDAPTQKDSWQAALFAVYPLKINELRIKDGDVTYRENATSNPIRLTNLQVRAENIRNVRSKPLQYPSRVQVDAEVAGGGRIKVDGHVDFFAEPSMGVDADVTLDEINLANLLPLTAQRQIQLTQGSLTTTGHVELAPAAQEVRLTSLSLHDVKADFVHAAQTKQLEQQTAQQVGRGAAKAANHPTLLLRIDQGKIERSEFGFVNQATNPSYRMFISGTELELENWSNQLSEGTARVRLDGMLMGRGLTTVTGAFRPEVESPDFDLSVRILKTPVKTLNQLLRAYGGIDAASGLFSVFSEVSVKNGAVKGYLKPLFKDVTVYDPRQDRDKGMLNQIYEKTINALASILKNTPRDEVATKTDLSGTVENPQASTWELVLTLFQNAFFDAVLPGLEGKVEHDG